MQEKATYFNIDSCLDRRVDKIEWNFDLPNTFISSYIIKKGTNFNNPNGLVLMWTQSETGEASHPSKVLEFTNTVTSLSFMKNNPYIVVGGSNTSRILVWDVRSRRKTPESMSTSSSTMIGNSDIIALKVTDSEFYSPIVAILSNGRICKWKLSMLSAPEDLIFEANSKKLGAVMCGDITDTSEDICVFGTQSGNIIKVDPYVEDSQKLTVLTNIKFPITSIRFNRCQFENTRLPLVLSTSLDGSLRLWNIQLLVDNKFNNSFVDSRWCPTHPAVYASGDCLGNVNLCNVVKSSVSFSHYKNARQKLCSSLAWSPLGSTLLCGKTDGKITAIHVDEKYTTPTREEVSKLNSFAEKLSQQEYNFSERSELNVETGGSSFYDGNGSRLSLTLSHDSLNS